MTIHTYAKYSTKHRLIIAGTRDMHGADERVYSAVRGLTDFSGRDDTWEIATGESGTVDLAGKAYAKAHEMTYVPFPADWNKHGKYAGPERNARMALWAREFEWKVSNRDGSEAGMGHLIAIWDGKSRGTADMILAAHRCDLRVKVVMVEGVELHAGLL